MLDIIDITNSSLFILSASESSTAKYHILLGFSLGLSMFHQPFNFQKTPSLCVFFGGPNSLQEFCPGFGGGWVENWWIFGVALSQPRIAAFEPLVNQSLFRLKNPVGNKQRCHDMSTCRRVPWHAASMDSWKRKGVQNGEQWAVISWALLVKLVISWIDKNL